MVMTVQEIEELAGHRQVPAWVVKLVGDAIEKEQNKSLLNSVHCQCGASWTFKDGALNYKPSTRGNHGNNT